MKIKIHLNLIKLFSFVIGGLIIYLLSSLFPNFIINNLIFFILSLLGLGIALYILYWIIYLAVLIILNLLIGAGLKISIEQPENKNKIMVDPINDISHDDLYQYINNKSGVVEWEGRVKKIQKKGTFNNSGESILDFISAKLKMEKYELIGYVLVSLNNEIDCGGVRSFFYHSHYNTYLYNIIEGVFEDLELTDIQKWWQALDKTISSDLDEDSDYPPFDNFEQLLMEAYYTKYKKEIDSEINEIN